MTFGSGKYTYEIVAGWGRLSEIKSLGIVSGVACDSQDRVYVFNRRPQGAVLVFDSEGNFLRSWGEGIFTTPHGIWISQEDEVYCTDFSDHTLRKFSLDGELLITLGTAGQPGEPDKPFNQPSGVSVSSSGYIYVSDGYGQSRVHKFASDGTLLLSWGESGDGPGQFNLPHNVCLDNQGRVYISDRQNRRVQVFTADGEFLTEWRDLLLPNEVFIDANGTVYIAEGEQRISILNLDGEVLARWGEKGDAPGQFPGFTHSVWVDAQGALYVGEVQTDKGLQKFARIV